MNSSRIHLYFDIGRPALLILPDQALALQNLIALLPTRISIKYYVQSVPIFQINPYFLFRITALVAIIFFIVHTVIIIDIDRILASSFVGGRSSWQ